jgi:hypothetical protein
MVGEMKVLRRALVSLSVLAALAMSMVALAAPAQALPTCTINVSVDGPGLSYWFWPAAANGDANCVMGRGNQGQAVRSLQSNLNICYGQGLAEDGIYGAATERAVRNVQARIGARADGVYGPETRSKMAWYTSAGGSPPCQVHW